MTDINVIVSPPIVPVITVGAELVESTVEPSEVITPVVPGTPPVGLPRGGTTGQIPQKASNADWDIIWVDNTGGGSGIGDAPNDANYYIRHGLAWTVAAAVAHTGAYADLSGLPTLGTAAAHDIGFFAAASHTHAASDIVSGTLADARIAVSNVTQHQASLAIAASQVTSGTFANARVAVGNVTQHQASLAIDYSQLTGTPPPLLVTKVYTVSSQVAQLALTAEEGDLAIRTDLNKTYARNSGSAGDMTDWSEMLTPTDTVASVFGRSGAVTAQSNDYTFSQIGSKPTTLAGYGITDAVVLGTRAINTTAPLTGGGDLSADRTISMPAATASVDGYATATQITKLNGIATGATANSSDATLLNRANHTNTQLASTISDFSSAADARVALKKEAITVACSDESTALTTGTKVTFRMAYAFTLTSIKASLTTAQTSGSIFTVDVKKNGTTVFSTLITIDNTEKTTATANTPSVLSTTALSDDDEITISITQIGDGTAKGLKVTLIGHQ